jgi:hypothetical protein
MTGRPPGSQAVGDDDVVATDDFAAVEADRVVGAHERDVGPSENAVGARVMDLPG